MKTISAHSAEVITLHEGDEPPAALRDTHCAFCHKPKDGETRMIHGPGLLVCFECVGKAIELLKDEEPEGDAAA